MVHKPFMGVAESADDGPIFVDTLSGSGDGKMVANLGNSDMKNFKTSDHAMELVNSEAVRSEFGLGEVSTHSHTPTPMPTPAVRAKRMGDLNAKTGEFWGLAGLAFAAGVLGKTLFDRYYK
jgi:hypothetical protein